MNNHIGPLLAWLLWSLYIVLDAGLVVLGFANGSSEAWGQVFASIAITTLPTVGALVAARRSDNPMGWLILAISLSFVASSFANEYALFALVTAPGSLPGAALAVWLSTWVGLPGTVLLLTFFFLLFPTGHLPSPRWRPVAWAAGAAVVLASLSAAFTPGNAEFANSPLRNPLGIESAAGLLAWVNTALQLLGIPLAILCAGSVVLRFRRAQGEERLQLKWFAYAIAMVLLFFVVNAISLIDPTFLATVPLNVSDVVFGITIALPGIAIGIAILKYRLYDIDVIIRRTLIYGALTAMLALTYFASVAALGTLARTITGQQQSDLVIVPSTLAIAALFAPLRQWIQRGIDYRFYRRKYDAALVLDRFGAAVREEVDINRLKGELVGVVQETVQPESISLWLRRMQ